MIPHNKPWITEDDQSVVTEVLASGWIADGSQVKRLEAAAAEYYPGGGAVALSSGSAALMLALKGLKLEKGEPVAVPTYACSAILNAVYMAGGVPRVVDVSAGDYVLSVDSLRELAPDVSKVIAVHTFGAPAPVDELVDGGYSVIEDCCQSLGGEWDGKPLGMKGDVSVFSFYATKIITGGHGGMLWSANSDLVSAVMDYRQFDCREDYYPRFNFLLTDIQAAMILNQWGRLNEIAKRRSDIALKYLESLPAGLEVQMGVGAKGRMNYRFVVECVSKSHRDALLTHLHDNQVRTIVPVERYELLHRYLDLDAGRYPVAERLVDTTLSLPIYPALSDQDVDHVCACLQGFAG